MPICLVFKHFGNTGRFMDQSPAGEIYLRPHEEPEEIVDALWRAKYLIDGNVNIDQGGNLHYPGRIAIYGLSGQREDRLLTLEPQVRVFGPCGSCFPPGILQHMNAGDRTSREPDESYEGETQTCDECRIYASDAGAKAALRRFNKTKFWSTERLIPASRGNGTPDEHELLIEATYSRGKIGFVVSLPQTNVVDRFEWPLEQWNHVTAGFDPSTSEEIRLSGRELEALSVTLDRYLENHS